MTPRTTSSLQSGAVSNRKSYTIVVGLNPALQKRFILSSSTPVLQPGNVHRASLIQEGIGGKGQDVAVSLSCLVSLPDDDPTHRDSIDHTVIQLVQFLGSGMEGDSLQEILQKRCNRGHRQNQIFDSFMMTVRIKAKLRTCTTIVARDDATELVEPSGNITQDEIQELLQRIDDFIVKQEQMVSRTSLGGIAFMGSTPPGCPNNIYANIYERVINACYKQEPKQTSVCCIVDSVVGLEPLTQMMEKYRFLSEEGRLDNRSSRNMLKINMSELQNIAGEKQIHLPVKQTDDLGAILNSFYQRFPSSQQAFDYIAITNGRFPAYLVCCDKNTKSHRLIYEFIIPDLLLDHDPDSQRGPKKLYPIGSGDAVAAATIAAWQYTSQGECANNHLDSRVTEALSLFSSRLATSHEHAGVVNAFRFGLACGSASCLQIDNSEFDIDDALQLVNRIEINTLKHDITS